MIRREERETTRTVEGSEAEDGERKQEVRLEGVRVHLRELEVRVEGDGEVRSIVINVGVKDTSVETVRPRNLGRRGIAMNAVRRDT